MGDTVVLFTQTHRPTIRSFSYALPSLVSNILTTDHLVPGFILFRLSQLLFWQVFLFNLHFQFLYWCTLYGARLHQGYFVTFSSFWNINVFIVQSILCMFIPLFSCYKIAMMCNKCIYVCEARCEMWFPFFWDVTLCHIPEERKPQLRSCKNPLTRPS